MHTHTRLHTIFVNISRWQEHVVLGVFRCDQSTSRNFDCPDGSRKWIRREIRTMATGGYLRWRSSVSLLTLFWNKRNFKEKKKFFTKTFKLWYKRSSRRRRGGLGWRLRGWVRAGMARGREGAKIMKILPEPDFLNHCMSLFLLIGDNYRMLIFFM